MIIFTKAMKKLLFYVFPLMSCFGVMLSSACKKNTDFQGNLIDVSKDLNAKMWQTLNDNGGDFALVFSTTQTQKCNNTTINAFPNVYSNNVIITVKDLGVPTNANCYGSGDYARDTTVVAQLANGTYIFQLNLKDVVFNKGSLVVSDNKYALSMETQNGVNVDASDLMRVPSNVIWGLVNYDNGADAQVDLFMNDLKSLAHIVSLDDGEYGHFQLNKGVLSLPAETQTTRPNTKKFFMKLDNSIKNLSDLVQKYQQQYGSKITFSVNTWNGKKF